MITALWIPFFQLMLVISIMGVGYSVSVIGFKILYDHKELDVTDCFRALVFVILTMVVGSLGGVI